MKKYLTLVLLAQSMQVSAATVLTNAISFTAPANPTKYALSVYRDPDLSTQTGIAFDKIGTTLYFRSEISADQSDWYVVTSGANFSLSAVENNIFPKFDVTNYFATISSNFVHLGVIAKDLEGNRDVVGWVRFVNYGGTSDRLDYLSSAVAFDASGITIGTQNATFVPEPSSFAFISGGAILLTMRSRKKIQANKTSHSNRH